MSLAPAFYIYVQSLTNEKGSSSKAPLHFIIPGIAALTAVFIHFFWLSPKEEYIFLTQADMEISEVSAKLQIAFIVDRISRNIVIVFILLYYWLTNKRVKEHREKIDNYFSNTDNVSLNWFKVFNSLFLPAFASVVIFHSLKLSKFDVNEQLLIPLYILPTIFLWIIGYFGSMQVSIYPQNETIQPPGNFILNDEITDELNSRLIEAFESRKVYLNPNLTLPGLARELGTNRSYLSKLINKEYQLNFNQFVNKHRVIEASKMLESKDYNNLTVKDIGDRCGFCNHNSFVRWFKEYFSSTPGEFRS